jgi:exodeoxyribonuclease VII large subunit
VGVVTSTKAAALRDMIKIIQRRSPAISILISPCLVQGEAAPGEIVKALERICRVPEVDVIILGRGGGAMEDLWAFNDERVVRAVADCPLPLVSAVGHETDFTLTDFAADLRASTPSAAAEMVAPDHRDIKEGLLFLGSRMRSAMIRELESSTGKVKETISRIRDPRTRLEDSRMRLDDLAMRLAASMKRTIRDLRAEGASLKTRLNAEHVVRKIKRNREELSGLATRLARRGRSITKEEGRLAQELHSRLQSMNPYQVLARGYSIASRQDSGHIITDSAQVTPSDPIELKVARGKIHCRVTGTLEGRRAGKDES